MMKNKILSITDYIVTILTSILLIALIASISILPIAKSKSYYMNQHEKNDVINVLQKQTFTGYTYRLKGSDGNIYHYTYPKDYIVNEELVEKATDHIINYLYNEDVESMQFQIETSQGNIDFFSDQAIVHMEDVKVLFIGGIKLTYIAIVLFILSCVYLVLRRNYIKKIIVKTYIITVIAFICFAIGLVIYAATDFSRAFEIFHYIIFPDNDKAELAITFYSWDTLTNVLTSEFFMHIGLAIGITFISILVFSIISSKLLEKYLPIIINNYNIKKQKTKE